MTQKDTDAEIKARAIKAFCEDEHGLFQHIEKKTADLSRQMINEEDEDQRNQLWQQARCYQEMRQHYKSIISNGVIASANLAAERQKEG